MKKASGFRPLNYRSQSDSQSFLSQQWYTSHMKIPGFIRQQRRWGNNLFDDLPFEAEQEAQKRLRRYCENHRGNPKWRWLYPILIGLARRWAMTTVEERRKVARTLRATMAGYATQRKYRKQGRTGEKHPSQKAARISVAHRKRARELKQEEEQRERQGLGPKTRTKYLPID
jgi:hypothetical protein